MKKILSQGLLAIYISLLTAVAHLLGLVKEDRNLHQVKVSQLRNLLKTAILGTERNMVVMNLNLRKCHLLCHTFLFLI